jgi:hypothetical protein
VAPVFEDWEKSILWQAALEYVAKGDRVIPIKPGEKVPMMKGWHENALTTAKAVDAHWSQHPEANIAICPNDRGQCVIEQERQSHTMYFFSATFRA